MAYQIDFSQLKFINDDTPLIKREPAAIFAKKESTDYFDVNSTICECNDDIQSYSFQLRFKLELKQQQPVPQNQDDKEFCNMGSSFGVNNNDNSDKQCDPIHNNNNYIESNHNQQSLGNVKQNFNQIQKRNASVQTNKLLLVNQQQLYKSNQKYTNHAIYQETLLSLKQKQSLKKFVSKKKNKYQSINLLLLLLLILFIIIIIMCL